MIGYLEASIAVANASLTIGTIAFDTMELGRSFLEKHPSRASLCSALTLSNARTHRYCGNSLGIDPALSLDTTSPSSEQHIGA